MPKQNLINPKKEIIPIYKPKGWPSFRVVKELRRMTGIKKIGYLGTLDPQAQGLLVVGIGQGAKKLKNLPADKSYLAEIAFGIETETWDLDCKTFKLVKSASWRTKLNQEKIKKILTSFRGEIKQPIPLYSAKKIKGKRLYKIARSGKKISLPQKTIKIYQIKFLDFRKKKIKLLNKTIILPTIKIKIDCGPGTFIRSLAYELGEKLKTKATLINLIRTKEGGFTIKNAIKIT